MFAAEPVGPAGVSAPAATESPTRIIESRSKIEQDIVTAFRSFGLGVEAVGTIEGPQVTRVRLKPASGVKVASLANRAEDLQVALALDQPPLISPGKGFVAVDLPRADRLTMLPPPAPCRFHILLSDRSRKGMADGRTIAHIGREVDAGSFD